MKRGKKGEKTLKDNRKLLLWFHLLHLNTEQLGAQRNPILEICNIAILRVPGDICREPREPRHQTVAGEAALRVGPLSHPPKVVCLLC